MKILFVSNIFPPHVVGGYELGCLMNAEAACRAGHDVRVVTSACFGTLAKKAFPNDLDVRQIFAPVYNYEFGDRSYKRPTDFSSAGGVHPGNCLTLAAAIDAWRPDVIWMHNPLGIGPVGILETAVASGTPTVVHLMDALDDAIQLSQHGFELAGRWAAAKSRVHAIACSRSTLRRNRLLGDFRSATVIPSGIPLHELGPLAPRPAIAPAEPVRMVYFGQIKSHKGPQHVVAALGMLRRRMGLNVELHLVGSCDTGFAAELRALAAADGCESALHWHGAKDRPSLHALLDTMHLAVLPLNENEAFGYVAPEAALHGMCVAVGANAGCAEVFPRDYPYFLERRDDPTAIAKTVQRICTNHDERRHWERQLPGYVRAMCELDAVCMPRYLESLEAAIADRPPESVGDDLMRRSLAAWQMNDNLHRLLGDSVPDPQDKSRRLGRRIERVVRRLVHPTVRSRFRPLVAAFRTKKSA